LVITSLRPLGSRRRPIFPLDKLSCQPSPASPPSRRRPRSGSSAG